jgi:hypothetical protein
VDVVLVVAGAALVVAAIWDISVTVLNPAAPGPFTFRLNRGVWLGLRALARRTGSRWPLQGAGPTTMAASFAAWLGALWLGFGLVYAAFVDQLVFANESGAGQGFVDALYASGVTLTTIGFGDVVPGSDGLRLLAVLEGATGFGAFTASIAYLISVYLVVGRMRSDAVRLSDLRVADVGGAAALVIHGGVGEVGRIQRELAQTHEDIRRFPNLYYFQSGTPDESVSALIRSSTMLCLVLRWGISGEEMPAAVSYGRALERTLGRLIHGYEERFLRGREETEALSEADVHARFATLRAAIPADRRAPDGEPPEEFVRFLTHADAFLIDLAREELLEPRPLLRS